MEKHRSKKPLIRFPEFKDAWEHKRLNELLRESKKRNEDLKFGKDKVLSVSGESGIVNQIAHLGRSYAGVSVHQYHVVDTGDIVYTKSPLKENPYGIIRLNKGKAGIVSTLYAVYKPNKQTAYAPFLDYYFSLNANTNRYLRPLVKKGAKNDMKINNEYVLNDKIFAPTLAEQKRIASFFSVIDKKISELQQKKNLLEEYKKGVVKKIFSRTLKFKDDKGKDFPKWEKKLLRDIAQIFDGTHQTPEYVEKGIPFYSVEQVTANDFHHTKFISEEVYKREIKRVKIEKGDILLTRIGDIGTPKHIDWNVKASFYVSLALIKQSPKYNSEYLNQYISTNNFQGELWKKTIHVAFPQKINLGEIGNCSVMLPSMKEQNKIASFLKSIDRKINSTTIQLKQTEQYRKGLLQKMFC